MGKIAGVLIPVFCLVFLVNATAQKAGNVTIDIPLGGNTFNAGATEEHDLITKNGIENWSNTADVFTTYIRVNKTGKLKLWMSYTLPEGESKIRFIVNKTSADILLMDKKDRKKYIGEWQIKDTGYVAITMKGISKTAAIFANVSSIKASSTCINDTTAFVKNNEGEFFYWGRRGPSVHLNYPLPDTAGAAWFYNEVTVPKDNDVIGSYFMADGFGEGYFGMQVNSDTERRVLFSVWSPFSTDDPKSIPEDQQVKMLAKGAGVHAGEFGNEGSGGQSYLQYNWKAGNTYKFLLHGAPDGNNNTIYTAYFFAPELNKWQLIASFKRPQTNTYLKHFHSFLENFIPQQGAMQRRVLFNNQWVCDAAGNWIEINTARFTTDNTGKKGYRMDYAGGLAKRNGFYLENCGFFKEYTTPGTTFTRPATGKKPAINFEDLPKQ